jgi:asparagine synthase (glutamine-hydrolysing)
VSVSDLGSISACFQRSEPPDAQIVESMLAAAPHRGRCSKSLIHGRCVLAVGFDDDPAGRLDVADGIAVGLAGTIDNLHELEAELASRGEAEPPTTPAGVLAATFQLYGEGTPARLRGVFAVVVSDGERLYCFRDHLGFAGLFYRVEGARVFAASEAKQVVAGARIRKEPNLDVLADVFFGSGGDTTSTALRGVERLPKGTILTADGDGVRQRCYWDPEPLLESARLSEDELQPRFDELMSQAIARCLTHGDEIVSLSGGIDSPAVAAFAAPWHMELTGRPLRALSVVFPDQPSVDERPYIELAAAQLGLELHTFEQKVNPLDSLAEWVELADGPVPTGSLALYADYYRRVRELGGRVTLSGELAEFVVDLDGYLPHHLLTHGRFAAFRGQLRGSKWQRALTTARVAASVLEPTSVTASRWRRRADGIPDWVDRRKANEAAAWSAVHSWRRWRTLQISPFTGRGSGLEVEEACQAVCGVRARRPWTDIDLWEFFLSLPAEVKLPDRGSKTLVRRLLRGRVPDEILDRRDKTFFDASIEASYDYPTLRRWLIAPREPIDGVDYRVLGERLEHEQLELVDYLWAQKLAGVHAFLSHW